MYWLYNDISNYTEWLDQFVICFFYSYIYKIKRVGRPFKKINFIQDQQNNNLI